MTMRREVYDKLRKVPFLWRYAGATADALTDGFIWARHRAGTPVDLGLSEMLVHCTYHKAGSTWLNNVLSDCHTQIFVCCDSVVDLSALRPHVGTHMMRDPRDLAVSGYHYHQWTSEPWAHRPRKELGGMSRQQYLKAVDRIEGMKAEIQGLRPAVERMLAWPRDDPRYLEITYEELINDEETGFRKIFRHYGFTPRMVEEAVSVAMRHSFVRATGRERGVARERSHLRSGKARQWEEEFTPELKRYFEEVHGDALVRLGYEASNDW